MPPESAIRTSVLAFWSAPVLAMNPCERKSRRCWQKMRGRKTSWKGRRWKRWRRCPGKTWVSHGSGESSAPTTFSPYSARVAWAKSIARKTPTSGATSLRRSRRRARRWTSAPTCGPSAACSMNCSPASKRLKVSPPPTLAAVLKAEPDWTLLPATTPASIRVLLRRCLQKDMTRRLRDATDARIEIEDALTGPPTAEATTVGLRARPTRNVWRWALVSGLVSLVVAVLTGIAVWDLRTPPPVSRLTITLPAGQRLAALDQPAIAISPDGKNLVYVAAQDLGVGTSVSPVSQGQAGKPVATGTQQLFLRPLDSQEAKPIARTEGAVSPFFSPDGQWIGFFAGGKLKKVSVNGGAPVTLANAPVPGGASWSSQGILVLQGTTVAGQGLQQVSQEGGTPQPLTRLGKEEVIHRWPEVLSGGKAVLFAGSPSFAGGNVMQVAVQPIGAGDRRNLVQGATQPRYASTGHLLYAQGGTLMVAPFDAKRLTLTRAAVPVLEGVAQSPTGAAQYSISSTGTLVYLVGEPVGSQSRLVWVSRNGGRTTFTRRPPQLCVPAALARWPAPGRRHRHRQRRGTGSANLGL